MKIHKSILISALVILLAIGLLVVYIYQNIGFSDLLTMSLGPPAPKQDRHISDALLRGDIPTLNDIQEIHFVRFPHYGSFANEWLYDYIGFPEAALTPAEVQEVVAALKEIKPVWEQKTPYYYYKLICEFDSADGAARDRGISGALLFKMKNGHLGLLSVSIADHIHFLKDSWQKIIQPATGTIFAAAYDYPRLCGVVRRPLSAINTAAARARIQPIPVLFPILNDRWANKIAEWAFGKDYDQCKNFILNSPDIKEALGNDLSVRLALGENWSGGFVGPATMLTFRIAGKNGEGAAKTLLEPGGSVEGRSYIVDGRPERFVSSAENFREAQVLYAEGSLRSALKLLSISASSMHKNDPECHYYLANTLWRLGRLSEAKSEYRQVLLLQPSPELARSCNKILYGTNSSVIPNQGYVGIQLKNDLVFGIFPKSPAEKAGLRNGDKLLTINDISINAKNTNEIAGMLMGPIGTKARFSFERHGKQHYVVLTRTAPGKELYKALTEDNKKD